MYAFLRVYSLLFLVVFSQVNDVQAICVDDIKRLMRNAVTPRQKLMAADAQQLAKIIAVDEETQELLSNPYIAQYVYINYFADDIGDSELRIALQQIVDDIEVANTDLFALVNTRLADKLNDPNVQREVAEVFTDGDTALRPGVLTRANMALRSKYRQMSTLFTSIGRMRNITKEGMNTTTLDRGLFDFHGAVTLGLPESQLRPWDIVDGGNAAYRPDQVENMNPSLWSDIAHFASETEAPINGYSSESGEAFRALMPSLSVFMGKNEEQVAGHTRKMLNEATDDGTHIPFCTNVWCTEENRHEIALQNMGEQMNGRPITEPKTWDAGHTDDYGDIDYAIKHMLGRNASEWNANSAYVLLMAHSNGPARAMVNNIRADETKHIAIFAAAYKYFFGSQPMQRTKGMLEIIAGYAKEHSASNSNGNVLSSEGIVLFEMMIAHLYVEKRMRDYMKTIPLKTLEKFFEGPIQGIRAIDSDPISPEKQRLIDQIAEREKRLRERLSRWKPSERDEYLRLKQVERDHAGLIEGLIRNNYNSFLGAEDVGSAAETRILRQIDRLRTGQPREINELIKKSLRETLRDYQIVNNEMIRRTDNLRVVLRSAWEGFTVVPARAGESVVLAKESLTDNSLMVRMMKPTDLGEVAPGTALKVTIETPQGPEVRVLSLSSSPNQEYLEIGVGLSDSDFKRALQQLSPGQSIQVEVIDNMGLAFDTSKPMVMIAGGIGITPFKSIIEQVTEEGLRTPMTLMYSNRSQIPFKPELDVLAARNRNLDVQYTLTRPEGDWDGAIGRIDRNYLEDQVRRQGRDSNYYIVGTPGMVQATRQNLIDLGVPEERIHVEAFAGYEPPASTAGAADSVADDGAKAGDETVCFCYNVSAGTIEGLASQGNDVDSIISSTGATTGCGQCKSGLCDLVKRCGR